MFRDTCVCVCVLHLMWWVTQLTATWVKAHSWRRWMGQVSEETTFSYTNPAGQEESSTHMHTYTHTQVHRQTCRHKFTGIHTCHTHTHLICSIFAVRAHLQTYAQPQTIYKAVQECCRCLHPFAQQVNLHGGIILSLWDAFQIHSSACDSSYNINTLSSAYLKQR